jgi:hypothetical protein
MSTSPPIDPSHWLHRLSPEDWMRAAVGEYEASARSFAEGKQRQGVASARRAAGMALNAVLCLAPDEGWGRSYMEHLRAAAAAEGLPEGVRKAAASLVSASLDAPALVKLGGLDAGPSRAALAVLEWAAARLGEP